MSGVRAGLDAGRVVQLVVEHEDGRRRGSGYRVSDTQVLTAAHVVEGARKVNAIFNADLLDHWEVAATVSACASGGDVAVLSINPPAEQRGVGAVRFGRLDRQAGRLSCRTVGFPRFKLRFDPAEASSAVTATQYRDVYQADGTIPTLSNWREGTLEVIVDPPGPEPDSRLSPWEGMSGAAVWCGDLIVGVVSRHHGREGLSRLAAVRVDRWYEQVDPDTLICLRGLLALPDRASELTDAVAAEATERLAALRGRRQRRLGVLDQQYEHEIAQWFVNPPGWEQVVSTVHNSGIVLLHGEAGSGRRTAAIRLLGEHQRPINPIHELSPQPDEPGEACLDPADVAQHDRLLLDLSAAGEERVAAIMEELAGVRGTVRERGASLVIVLPARVDRRLRRRLEEPIAEIGRPDGRRVFDAHLRAHSLRTDSSYSTKPLAEIFARASIVDIAYLVRLVRDAQQRSSTRTFADCLNEALRAQADRAPEVAKQLRQHGSARFRAMLFASASLEHCSPEDVFQAQRLLLRTLNFNDKVPHDLEQPDLRARFEEIEADADGLAGVQFKELNYAEAVRKYFWANFPSLRVGFRKWVIECGRQIQFSEEQGEDFARRYANDCLRAARSADLVEAVEEWASPRAERMQLAATALEHGLTDPGEGWVFRKKCYFWSRNQNVESSLAYLVISVCVDVIAPNYPSQAIVRLHHLTRSRDDGVAEAARGELVELTKDRGLLRRLLARLTDPDRGHLNDPRGRALFLAVVDGHRFAEANTVRPLIVEAAVRRQLVVGWRAVLSEPQTPECEYRVWQWLEICSQSHQTNLLTVLIEACSGEFAQRAVLYASGRRWLHVREQEGEHEMAVAAARETTKRLERGIVAAGNETTP